MGMEDLADCLRAWRDRLDPAELGLPRGSRRRAPGLRREELADLAGLSVDYLARLEQGRATKPSVSVLEPLARALRLTDAEREHLFRLAGHGTSQGQLRRHLSPGVQRVLDRCMDVPVLVIDAGWEIVAINPLGVALLGEELRERPNVLRRYFGGDYGRVRHAPGEAVAFEEGAVADLHATLGRHPDDPALLRLVAELRASSPRFAELWEARPVGELVASRKVVHHPEVGPIELDCDTLMVQGCDLRLVMYTAAPGSEAASKVALLSALGCQPFAAPAGAATSSGTP